MNAVLNRNKEHLSLIELIRQEILKNGEFVGRLPVDMCKLNPAINPRKNVNKAERELLKNNIAIAGVQNGILVRILDDDSLEVVAGSTRWSISEELQLRFIPATVRILSLEEAIVLAAAENRFRVGNTATDEADHFSRRLISLNGDFDALCTEMGIQKEYLSARLPLTRAVLEVREALANDIIKIGHAQLCVTLPEAQQVGFLKVIVDGKLTIADSKARLDSKQRRLSNACFDTAECKQCPSNTGFYKGLFQTTESTGDNCRNSKCFSEKSKLHINSILGEKQKEFGVAKLDINVGKETTVMLTASGSNGVGTEQLQQCASCEHYGCVISTIISREGEITGDVCFNLACHGTKVKAFKNLIASDTQSIEKAKLENVSPDKSSETTKDIKAVIAPPITKSMGDLFLSKGIKRYAFQKYAKISSQESKKSPHVVHVISVFGLWREVKRISHHAAHALLDGYDGSKVASDTQVLIFLLNLDDMQLNAMQIELCKLFLNHIGNAEAFEHDEYSQFSIAVLKSLDIKLVDHWQVNEEYLQLLTKAAIQTLLEKSGFKEKYIAEKGEKLFNALLANKMAEIPKLIMEYKVFSWAGYLPHGIDFNRFNISKIV